MTLSTYFYSTLDSTRVTLSTELFTYFFSTLDCTRVFHLFLPSSELYQRDTFHRVLLSQRDTLNNRGGGSCSLFGTKQILVEKWPSVTIIKNTSWLLPRRRKKGLKVLKKTSTMSIELEGSVSIKNKLMAQTIYVHL